MDDLTVRVEQLETSMREHTHSTLDSTSPLDVIKPVIQNVVSSATVTPRSEEDCVEVTTLAVAITFNNPTGTAWNFKKLLIRVKDNGTARGITWGTMYIAGGFALPSTTILGKWLTLGFLYNASLAKYQLIGYAQES